MEVIQTLLLFVLAFEGAWLMGKKANEEEEAAKENPRRRINGEFSNPLGDTYRKNTKGHLVPVHPGSKMIDGDDEGDEV